MKNDLSKWIEQANNEISQGNGSSVRRKLRLLKRDGVPRLHTLDISQLARRTGMYHFATNILSRQLRDQPNSSNQSLLAEYASSISAQGNYSEGKDIFISLTDQTLQDYAFEYVDNLFKNWEYQKAATFLESINFDDLKSYKGVVLYLNYASALLGSDQKHKCANAIDRLIRVAEKSNYRLILGNCYEIKGQLAFRDEDYLNAKKLFLKSEQHIENSSQVTWLYTRKWLCLCSVAKEGINSKTKQNINQLKILARNFLSWETLRDTDLHLAYFTCDEALMSRVYHGTPHKNFKKRALKIWHRQQAPPPLTHIGPLSEKTDAQLDLNHGTFCYHDKVHKLEEATLLFFRTLSSDLYAPISVYNIFQHINPGNFFNPHSSKDLIYKAVKRFRKNIDAAQFPFKVTSKKGYGYRLRTSESCLLIYQSDYLPNIVTTDNNLMDEINLVFGNREFTRKAYEKQTGQSSRSSNRKLKTLVESGMIIKMGHGMNIKYRKAS